MKPDGIVNFGDDLDEPDVATVARAIGLHAVRVERPSEVEERLRTAFATHMTARRWSRCS